ncbi:hypothetical protein [Marasmitruncus massiliensis]|uniref:hypothetical protein n=1 Tax=Marasmitruncus massiliensis TaxID=1944642 RepID=UPI000C7B80F3|nr:hypothetical protein [Marasmitruncus massiliensis]
MIFSAESKKDASSKGRNVLNTFCSRKCYAAKRYLDNNPEVTKTCAVCGKPFQTRIKNDVYCSDECKDKASQRENVLNRDYTELTPYLCQKWRREGMSIKKIAALVSRSPENVRKALKIRLSREDYATMEEYAR